MSNTIENCLFLGLPKSGKTTYFSLMAQHLQNAANRTKTLKFRYRPTRIIDKEADIESMQEITSDFIEDCVGRLKKQKWPRKTQDYHVGYSFELVKYFAFLGKPILKKYFYRTAVIDYHDYPGEAFELAFGISANSTPEMQNAAEDMLSKISSARGLFLILDAEAMFNRQDASKLSKSLTLLFRKITVTNPNIKLAVIFNKLELFGEVPDLVTKLRKDYSNAFAYLPHNHKFFNVYPLGAIETPETGEPVPPKKMSPRMILDPVKWIIPF